ncbi:inner membrane protein YdcO [mine drainage metagenome]|uniref:Inner membrane protein YdcO n=1 Tax=mine drainage metagenome TaxID=410659 RepID=A0A1J5REN2_9ZZZZ
MPDGHRLSATAVGAGLLAALVGYTSSVAVVLAGLDATGASPAQKISGLAAVTFAMGLSGIWLSLKTRMPISVVWTTPGMALVAATPAISGGYPAALGAFLLTALLVVLSGLFRPLGRWTTAIPRPLSAAMLAGILLELCLAPFQALARQPAAMLAILLTWAVVGRLARLFAVPAALAVALVMVAVKSPVAALLPAGLLPHLLWTAPHLTWGAAIGIALPLFIVTMASQNIPGLTVLHSYDYQPPVPPLFWGTGLVSALIAPFGGPTVNLAAITAALCAGPEAGQDRARRWQAAVAAGLAYMALAALAALTVGLIAGVSPLLIEAVAGLALLAALGQALKAAVAEEAARIPALVTFLVTASGFSAFGIGPAFWGLVLGGALHLLFKALPQR